MLKKDWKLNHVGLVVRDWNRPLGFYQTTGMGISVGPQVVSLDFQKGGASSFFYNDKLPRLNGGSGPGRPIPPQPKPPEGYKKDTYRFMDKDCQVGDLLFEILQDRKIPFEGITHLCFNVPDVAEETNRLLEKGCEIALSFTQGDFICENYIDTREFGHVIISFRPPVEKYEKAWTAHNLSHPMVSDWKFRGLGIAVNDLDRTVAYYESLAFTEFKPEDMIDSRQVKDAQTDLKARSRIGLIGNTEFEFVQPLEGAAIYQESLDSRGEGICEMIFMVGNLEEEIKKLDEKEVPVILAGEPGNGPPFAYFDTREPSGNIVVRLVQQA